MYHTKCCSVLTQSLYKAMSGHGQPENYKQPAVLSDGQVWIPLGRAVFLEADFRTSEVGDTAMSVFKVRFNLTLHLLSSATQAIEYLWSAFQGHFGESW